MSKYTIGVDFGTLSGRSILVDIENGQILQEAVWEYANSVIDETLPNQSEKLPFDFALQDPNDYLEVLYRTIPQVISDAKVASTDVIGIGIDFTACTMMPVTKDKQVLCQLDEFKHHPYAWVKLWKHHSAQYAADKLNQLARDHGFNFLDYYGGKISSEWFVPKVMETLDKAPEIYDAAYTFMEAADWITMQLTDNDFIRNSCTAGYKAMWNANTGFVSKDFMKLLDPRLETFFEEKYVGEIKSIGESAGFLSEAMAQKLGLSTNVAVSVANVDAHVSAAAVNVVDPGKMLMIMGTSTCDILLGEEEKVVEGMCGVVKDGAIKGYYAYESGQSGVGDIFDWFVSNYISSDLEAEAKEKNVHIHTLLENKASQLKVGESGLLALDWWNGNRSILVDTNLQGMMLGMTLATKPEEIYRALIESTAFGKRVIIEGFETAGVPVNELYACGGLSVKNRMLMQIYADVLNKEIKISDVLQTPALGSAIFAAVAAGKARGGYDDIKVASKHMSKLKDETFKPIKENVEVYDKIYAEFKILHDYFGKGGNNVMKRLKAIKLETR